MDVWKQQEGREAEGEKAKRHFLSKVNSFPQSHYNIVQNHWNEYN